MTHAAEATVTLPNGYWQRGIFCREARVRAVGECDEALGEALSTLPLPIQRATLLLSRCVVQLGQAEKVEQDEVCDLSMGDREALLLHIRRLTFGERMPCVLRCAACDAPMDLDLDVSSLLVSTENAAPRHYQEMFSCGDPRLRVSFHVPTGTDVEAAIQSGNGKDDKAGLELLARCIELVEREDGIEEFTAIQDHEWPSQLVEQLSRRLAKADPQAEIQLQLTCPACECEFSSFFDVTGYMVRELEARERQLYQDVHQLASAYHWSESEILHMSSRKRKLYLEMLAGEQLA
jgi:hypothetical protein